MKKSFQHIAVCFVLLLACSCDNDFLNEEPEFFGEGTPITISPEWEASDYSIFCRGAGNANFRVTRAPEWLEISSPSGQFINDNAILNIKANAYGEFSEIGIYHSLVILSVEGKGNVYIQISYIIEGNPVIEMQSGLNINQTNIYDFHQIHVRNTGNGILFWTIAYYPEWLRFSTGNEWTTGNNIFGIVPPKSSGLFYVSHHPDFPLSGNRSGKIFVASNDKDKPFVEMDVNVEMQSEIGAPSFHTVYGNILDFGETETARQFSFSNQGNSALTWTVEGCPSWLSVLQSSGITHASNSTLLTFTCNREFLPSGESSATVYLKTNDINHQSYPITVTAFGSNATNPSSAADIEGNITGAFMDRQEDILYLSTNQPNRLLAFDMKTKTIARELALPRAPNCFRMSEDGSKAVVGHSGYISYIDMEKFEIIKTIEVNFNIFDIEWDSDSWVCYTPGRETQSYRLQWKNLDTEETIETPFGIYGLYGGTILKKIPRQDFIVASSLQTSPSGITIFDVRKREPVRYFHQEIGRFWFSEDGRYLFSSNSRIYRTSAFFSAPDNSSTSPIGSFSVQNNQRMNWIDHHAASQSLWILFSDVFSSAQSHIVQFEDNDYTRTATYNYNDRHNERHVQAHYVFANQAGTELTVIRNATSGDFMWSLEFIPITN